MYIDGQEVTNEEICFGSLDIDIVNFIQEKLRDELKLTEIALDNMFYICECIDLNNPQHALIGKLVESFQAIKNEEPNNPNALYRLVFDTVQKKASYEKVITNYNNVLQLKGISKDEFDKILEAHRKKSITGIEQVRDYIKMLPPGERRLYNQALTSLLDIDHSHDLIKLKKSIFIYVEEHINMIKNEDEVLRLLSNFFDNEFSLEFTKIMKNILYLIVFYIYTEGGDI